MSIFVGRPQSLTPFLTLRKIIDSDEQFDLEDMKKKLLEDPDFLRKIADYIRAA